MIPIARPQMGEDEKSRVWEAMSSGSLAQGPRVRELEERFAAFIGAEHAVATSSGTTALHLALLGYDIGPGDEVITVPFTFIAAPQFDVTVRNIFERAVRAEIERSIGEYELTVLLHACTADSLLYAEPLAGALQNRKGKLVAFVGNELNLPFAPLGAKIAWLKRVRPDIVATQLLEEAGAWLYADVGARVISLPHALNPQAFQARTSQRDRPIDIGARSFRYLAYLGDDERNRIYDFFAANRFSPKLALDFSTEQRFDRAGWAAFLDRCKATIATEAGSWFLERDDATVLAIRDYLAAK